MRSSQDRPTGPAFAILLAVGLIANAWLRTCSVGHHNSQLLPNAAMPLVAFVALRWPPLFSLTLALLLGADEGFAAAAPTGLVPASMATSCLTIATLRWHYFGRSAVDLALTSALCYAVARISAAVLLLIAGWPLGTASWAEAALLPGALLHGFMGWLCHLPLLRLWRLLSQAAPSSLGDTVGRR